MQYNDRLDTGAARGKLTFETFEDLLVGLSAADNQSPGGRSNIETVRANEGVGPNGEVQYQYRHYYGAGFAQDDFKVTPRLALNAGLRWEYVGPSSDSGRHDRKRLAVSVEASRRFRRPRELWSAMWLRRTTIRPWSIPTRASRSVRRPRGYRPRPPAVSIRTTRRSGSSPPGWVLRGSRSEPPGARRCAAGTAGFTRRRRFSANAGNAAAVHRGAVCARIHQYGLEQWPVGSARSRFRRPRWALCRARRPPSFLTGSPVRNIKSPTLQQWNLSVQTKLPRAFTLDIGYVGSYGDNLLVGVGLNQPVLASCQQSRQLRLHGSARRLHHHQYRRKRGTARSVHGREPLGVDR